MTTFLCGKSAALLNQKGYTITLSTLHFMIYAMEMLDPHIRTNIGALLGRPQVKKISRLDKCFRKLCNELEIPEEDQRKMFIESIQNYDEPNWSFESFRRLLETSLAKNQSTSVQDIYLRLEGYLTLSMAPLSDAAENLAVNPIVSGSDKWPGDSSNMMQKERVYTVNTKIPDETPTPTDIGNGKMPKENSQESDNSQSPVNLAHHGPIIPELEADCYASIHEDVAGRIKVLRGQAYELAWNLAKRHKLLKTSNRQFSTVVNTGNWGIGFLVRDFPVSISRLTTNAIWTERCSVVVIGGNFRSAMGCFKFPINCAENRWTVKSRNLY